MTDEEQKAADAKAAEDAKAKADADAAAEAEKNKGAKPDSEKTVDELKAEAEAAEAEYKKNRDGATDEEIRKNYIRRRDKALGKAETVKDGEHAKPKDNDVDTRDLITLGKADIAEDSEKAKILAKYKAGGLIKNYAEGLDNVAIKAEFEALDAKKTAKTVIDENDSTETQLKTKKEVIAAYKASGEVPDDPKLQKTIAEENLKEMGL